MPLNKIRWIKSNTERHEDAVDQSLATTIRQRRIVLSLTVNQAAELISINPTTLEKYELGTNRLSASRLYRIAKALGVHPSYFFDQIDDEKYVWRGPMKF